MYRRIAALIAPLGMLLLAAAGDPPAADIVAQRGDTRLTAADVRQMLDHVDPATRARAEQNPASLAEFVRDKMLDRALLSEAKAKGWDQQPEIIQRINDARDAVIVQTYAASLVPPDPNFPPEATVTATYEANKAKFTVPRQFHLAQIAILVPKDAKPDVDEAARRRAVELRVRAVKSKTDFAQLAQKNSQDQASAEKGGDIGWMREDTLVPAIRGVVAQMSDGTVSEVIHLPDGYHILRLLGVRPAEPAPLQEVRPQIVQALVQARNQQEIRNYVAGMLKAQPIQLNEIDLAQKVKAAP